MNGKGLPESSTLEIGTYAFEQAHTFTYLSTTINKENDITEEVQNS
jgi:hypothetical protein